MNDKLVSIFCLTYNHVDYIRDALEGFVKQKTNFQYEVFVYDDASTDGKSECIQEYASRYPQLFNIYISPYNTYNSPDRFKILNELQHKYITGKYVAMCEGDDYWIDSKKLQMQVDYMEEHDNCMMTTHAYKKINYSNKGVDEISFADIDRNLTKEEIITNPQINLATSSLIMRRKVFFRDDKFPKCDVGDIPRQLYALSYGDIYYFNRVMSVYRYMHKGSWTSDTFLNPYKFVKHKIGFVQFLTEYNIYSSRKFENLVWQKIKAYLYSVVENIMELDINKRNEVLKYVESYGYLGTEIIRVYRSMCGESEEVKNLLYDSAKKFNIVILGAGKYSFCIEKMLKKLDTEYFKVITKKDENHRGVITLSEYPYEQEKTIIIVGISQLKEQEILSSLAGKKYKKIIYPLWFNREILMR